MVKKEILFAIKGIFMGIWKAYSLLVVVFFTFYLFMILIFGGTFHIEITFSNAIKLYNKILNLK